MKKYIILTFLMIGTLPVFADTAAPVSLTLPATPVNTYLGGQVALEIINHGSFYKEYQVGSQRIIVADNVAEAGHVNGSYIFALDASLYQDKDKTSIDYEGGINLHLNAVVNNYVTYNQEWSTLLGNLEYGPRVGYDFGQDEKHAWFASFNLGYGFGPGSGAATAQ